MKCVNSNYVNKLFLLFIVVFVSCNKNNYRTLEEKNSQVQSENGDYIKTSKDDSIILYKLIIDTLLSKTKFLRLHTYNELKFMNGQDLIGYDYCESKMECDTTNFEPVLNGNQIKYGNFEITGQIRKPNSHWMHPPRVDYFRILEMNAFPYYVSNEKEWNYELNFGDHWGDKRWMTWVGRKTSYSKYELKGKINYKFEDQVLECFEIVASTKINSLGETESTFYYHQKYGFVYMLFKTLNNQNIEFKMINF